MTKRSAGKFRASRQFGMSLWGSAKDPVGVKNYIPGQHGNSGKRRVTSDYGKQLAAKQKLKKYYGNITEKQFRRIYKEAIRKKGDTSENLVALLEMRLDAVIYRAGFVPTVFAARQFVNHKHLLLNGKKANIGSITLKIGDVIKVRDKSMQIPMVIESSQKNHTAVPEYLKVDHKKGTIEIASKPAFADVPYPVVMEPNLVIEFYSR